ncbi:MAG: GNAT family N-acetyltransferase [Gammaproteobacteria bacterium]|nr:GNAT family N-acetyltransferase [Gammaproteobacteria bacterium]
MEWSNKQYRVSTDKAKLQVDVIHRFLESSYWAENISRHIVEKAIDGSLCFGVYKDSAVQIGFARLVTDHATFAYLMDVFILEEYRGAGLGKWLMACIMEYPEVSGLRRFLLGTLNTHGLYSKFGFKPLAKPDIFMEINVPNPYKKPT